MKIIDYIKRLASVAETYLPCKTQQKPTQADYEAEARRNSEWRLKVYMEVSERADEAERIAAKSRFYAYSHCEIALGENGLLKIFLTGDNEPSRFDSAEIFLTEKYGHFFFEIRLPKSEGQSIGVVLFKAMIHARLGALIAVYETLPIEVTNRATGASAIKPGVLRLPSIKVPEKIALADVGLRLRIKNGTDIAALSEISLVDPENLWPEEVFGLMDKENRNLSLLFLAAALLWPVRPSIPRGLLAKQRAAAQLRWPREFKTLDKAAAPSPDPCPTEPTRQEILDQAMKPIKAGSNGGGGGGARPGSVNSSDPSSKL